MRKLLDLYDATEHAQDPALPQSRGIVLRGLKAGRSSASSVQAVLEQLDARDLAAMVQTESGLDGQGRWLRLWLAPCSTQAWAPGHDTMQLAETLGLATQASAADLQREILLTLLMSPEGLDFPSLDELVSAIRIRRNIVQAARRTTLAFDTQAAERPEDCWIYHEDKGFTLLPGVPLIDALIKTTQPEVSGRLYSFSCYRATEYVLLLGIAQELAQCNPELFERLQCLWQQRAIMSEEFHNVFLREQGTMEAPLPPLYYVPGDRVWFRNPDEASADACGFEGSWVMYLGSGQFTNFWKQHQPYTLTRKCVEIYHWRHGLYQDAQGESQIDEQRIEPLIEATLANPVELARVMALMTRWREPRGVYTEAGGCMDTTREFARWVRPGSADMPIPNTRP
jgi:Protein-glutamine gamma-glutamyltransferase